MTTSFALDQLGSVLAGAPVRVTAARSAAFAAAINDKDPHHLEGRKVPPMLAVVPIYSVLYAAVDRVTPAAARSRAVHGAHEIRFERPMHIGSVLQAAARVVGVHAKRSGTAVTIRININDEQGRCSEQWATAFVRGVVASVSAGEEAPALGFTAEGTDTTSGIDVISIVDQHQTFRYAAASGDAMQLHLDDELARSFGFAGIIAHGLWTMSATSVAAVSALCSGEPDGLRRLAVRMAAPVYPGDVLTTHFRKIDTGRFVFATTNGADTAVVKDGLVETCAGGAS